ncbi:amino acid adenylation domain-containing protein [Streptomyces antarcticus]|uniref:amino acid adenylation domain-containing protein n=1 Tax=Streptomyces antarcticus TaxID=2996458 RepID=UPI00226E6AE2|nr:MULTISPECIES: amino acid adenylation domain-containing protein [unclassified Streptomyces]MCY0944144.1 amino acid adenylation domain-containing protein [Streptomyces sp. H34-AA3]MCZ4086738.1 amino acid adenylation domain-containing protein [Streptomyces sp. H34-S5]
MTTLHARVVEQARRTPDAPAVHCGDQVIGYAELDRRAEELVPLLHGLGVGPETPVGIHLRRGPELPVALLAVLKAGGYCVPLDPGYPAERLRLVLEEVAAPVVLTVRALRDGLPRHGATVVSLDEPADPAPAPAPARTPAPARPAARPGAAAAATHPQTLAWASYTSGSTGRPKGVMLSHGPLASLAEGIAARLELTPEDRVLQFASIGFSVAAEEIFSTWYAGACLVLDPDESLADAASLHGVIEKQGVTVLQLTPAYWYEWLRELDRDPDGAPVAPESLRLLVVGSEQVSADKAGEWLTGGVRLVQEYGATEGTVSQLLYEPSAPAAEVRAWPRVPVGTPLPGISVRVLDESLRAVPDGEPGELYVAGDCVSRGYLARPGLTAERFLPDPASPVPGGRMYRTGDLAVRRPDGNVEFLGRIDHQLKVHGIRIEPGEVEAAIGSHPGVARNAVLARESATGAAQLVACVVWEGAPDPAGLRAHLRARLAPGLVPARLVAVPELPLNPNGKIDRNALRVLPLDVPAPASAGSGRRPRSAVEAALAGIWSMLLDLPSVGAEDDFFLLGGDSLTATRLSAHIREALGADIRQHMVFETPTVAGLAARIETARRTAVRPAAPPPAALGPKTPAGPAADPESAVGPKAHAVPDVHAVPDARAVPAVVTAPATPAQRQMWMAHRMGKSGAAYNEPLVLRMTGPLDPDHVKAAVRGLLRRHGVLRTTLRLADGLLTQFVAPPASAAAHPLPVTDLEGASPAQLGTTISELASLPFDLARGPLIRTALLRLGAEDHVLVLVMHHTVCDGWSLDVLHRDVSRLYREALTGEPAGLPELPVSYAEHARLRHASQGGPQEAAQLAYWARRLAGAPAVTRLPVSPGADPARPGGVSLPFAVDADTSRRLRALAAAERTTPYVVLLAAFKTLVHRTTGAEDLVVGGLSSGRDLPQLGELMGLFVNTLALRTEVPAGGTFRELVRRVRTTVREAVGHQDVPFDRVVREVCSERGREHSPVFQLMFSFGGTAVRAPELEGLTVEPLTVATGAAKFDAAVMVEEAADGSLTGTFEFRLARYEETDATRLTERYSELLQDVSTNPDQFLTPPGR